MRVVMETCKWIIKVINVKLQDSSTQFFRFLSYFILFHLCEAILHIICFLKYHEYYRCYGYFLRVVCGLFFLTFGCLSTAYVAIPSYTLCFHLPLFTFIIGFIFSNIYDKRDNCTFDIVKFFFLDGDFPCPVFYGVYDISQLIRVARAWSSMVDCNKRNQIITETVLKQGYRYHKPFALFLSFIVEIS